MATELPPSLTALHLEEPLWDRFFTVAPLVLVGTREPDGGSDFAPKHMVSPMGWDNYFGFVCAPSHATYVNAGRTGEFTVSYPRPSQILETSLAAAPRTDDQCKPSLQALQTFAGTKVNAELVKGGYLFFECKLDRVVEFSRNSLIVGEIVAAYADSTCIRSVDRDGQDILLENPLLVYIHPARVAEIRTTQAFPFHKGMRK